MGSDLVDGVAVQQLRTLFKLDRENAAKLCNLTLQQLIELEEGGIRVFNTPSDKIQAALRFAKTLSGVQKNGLPNANVFKSKVIPAEALGTDLNSSSSPVSTSKKNRYSYRTNPFQLALIAGIIIFIFLLAVMPALSTKNPDKKLGDIVIPKTWQLPK